VLYASPRLGRREHARGRSKLPRRQSPGVRGRSDLVPTAAERTGDNERGETKVWPAARFVETINEIRPATDLPCVLVGGADEFDLCEGIKTSCESSVTNLAGRTSLPQLASILKHAHGVLCHDSAVAHLATAFDRPLVCITGPTNPLRTGPYRRIRDVVQLELDCAPCYLRKLSDCSHHHRCMQDLPSDRVVSALTAAVARGGDTSRT